MCGLSVPLVVRLEGTNVELGKEIVAKYNLGDIVEGEVTGVVDFSIDVDHDGLTQFAGPGNLAPTPRSVAPR